MQNYPKSSAQARSYMKALHVVEHLSDAYGGPARSIPELCFNLSRIGVESEIFSVAIASNDHNSLIASYSIKWNTVPACGPRRFYFSPNMRALIAKNLTNSGNVLLHTHSLWTYPTYCAFSISSSHHIPLICSIRSNLYAQSLRRSRFRKCVPWALYVKQMLNKANCVHATEPSEIDAIRDAGIVAPVALIPNGVRAEEFDQLPPQENSKRRLGLDPTKRHILYLSRIHPRKNLDVLVDAWITLAKTETSWDIIVAGPEEDPAYAKKIKARIAASGLVNRVHFVGMLSGTHRLLAYAACDLFVLPSKFENFGMAIAEALAAGKPVVTTIGTPWQEIRDLDAGWWIENDVASITCALREAFSCDPEELRSKGSNGANLVRERYAWATQARKMKEVYSWMLGANARPSFVHVT